MIRPPTGDGFQDYSGVAQSPLADKQQSANVRYSRGDWLQRVDLRPSTMSRVRPGADIERARRERSFISMQTTGPAFVPHLAANNRLRRRGTSWHRLGPMLTLAGCIEDHHENDSQRASCVDASLHLQPA